MSDVLATRSGGVLTLSLNRAHKKNALDAAMYHRLQTELLQAQADNALRVVVLLGDVDVFCAGNDVGDFAARRPEADAPSPAFGFLEVLSTFPKPLLAGVCGPAVGIGATMLFHCDTVHAGSNAVFSLPFVKLGLCPEAGSSLLAPAVFGHQRAASLFLTGQSFGAQEALSFGLVQSVMAPADVAERVQALAQEMAQWDLDAMIETKRLLKAPWALAVREQMLRERESFERLVHAPAAQRAFARFLGSRSREPQA